MGQSSQSRFDALQNLYYQLISFQTDDFVPFDLDVFPNRVLSFIDDTWSFDSAIIKKILCVALAFPKDACIAHMDALFDILGIKHFAMSELLASSVAKERNIRNFPIRKNQYLFANFLPLLATLEIARSRYRKPIVVTSGYRSDTLNRAVRGANKSYHKVCRAVDVHWPTDMDLHRDRLSEILVSLPNVECFLYPDKGYIHFAV